MAECISGRNCGGWKPTLRSGSRCEECEAVFVEYQNSGWGLDELVKVRDKYQALGLCFMCGTNAAEGLQRCADCQYEYEHNNWKNNQISKGVSSDSNPYSRVWDAFEDNTTYLVPSYGVMANRMRDKVRYHARMALRGGPKGREDARDAAIYARIADEMQVKEDESRKLR